MHYRLYELKPSGGIIKAHDLVTDSDAEAFHAALDIYPSQAFELWCGTRQVSIRGQIKKQA